MDNKKVSFSAEDNISPFIKNLRREVAQLTSELTGKGKQTYAEFAKIAQEQTKNSKEQLRVINDQITALKKKLDVERELTRMTLEQQREYAGEAGQEAIAEQLVLLRRKSQQDAILINELREKYTQDASSTVGSQAPARSVFGDIMRAGLVRDIVGMMRQTVGAQTGLDLLTPSLGMAGAGAGTLIGTGLEALTLGQIEFATIGAQMGEAFGEMAGQGITRHIQTKEKFLAAALGIESLTGQAMQGGDLSKYGLDRTATAELEKQIIHAIPGYQTTNRQQIENVAAISKWAGIDTGTITELLKTRRMGNRDDETAIADMFTYGIDRSSLGDAATKLTALLQGQGERAAEVHGGEAMTRLMIGQRLGGPFGVADPRSTQLELAYQSKLANPGSAFAQALSYSVLREMNPEMSVVELIKKRQEGGVRYEGALLKRMSEMTGSGDLNTLLYSQLFGTGTMAFDQARLAGAGAFNPLLMGTDRTPDGRSGIGGGFSISASDPMEAIRAQAVDLTTQMQKDMAAANNAFILGFTDGIEAIATQFENRFLQAFESFIDSKLNDATKNFDTSAYGQGPRLPKKAGSPPAPGQIASGQFLMK